MTRARVAKEAGDLALMAMLQQGLAAAGHRTAVRRLERRPCAYGSTFGLEEVDVALEDGRTLELIFKDLGPAAAGSRLARPRPAFMIDPAREVLVYRHVLARLDLGTPRSVAAVVDPPARRYWLLLERVNGLQLCHVGDFGAWEEAARWLARFHLRARDEARRHPVPWLVHDRAYDAFWIAHLQRRRHELEASIGRAGWSRLCAAVRTALSELADLAHTAIHGEFYPSNVIVRSQPPSARPAICPVDWETAGLGPGVVDLAGLASGQWSADDRRALAAAYRDECLALGGECPPLDRWLTLLDAARLLLAARMLAWPADWEPPPEHRRDWLADALAIAASREGLGAISS